MRVIKEHYPGTNILYLVRTINDNNKLHSFDDKPAYQYYDTNGNLLGYVWYDNGLISRKKGPAIIEYKFNRKYRTIYKTNGYCIQREKCNVKVYNNDKVNIREWVDIHGVLHRNPKIGPARIVYNDMGKAVKSEYFLNGIELL